MLAPIQATGGNPLGQIGLMGAPMTGMGPAAGRPPMPFGADGANLSPEAAQEGAAAGNPQMQQQMKQMMNDLRLMTEVQQVQQAQQAAQQAMQQAAQAQAQAQQQQQQGQPQGQDPQAAQDQVGAAIQRLGQDYQNIKQGGGQISPQVEQMVQQTLGMNGQQQQQQQQQQPAAQQAAPGGQQGAPGGQQAGPGGDPAGPGGAPAGQQAGPNGDPAGPGGAPGGDQDAVPGGNAGAPTNGPAGADGPDTATNPPALQGNDQQQADFINKYLQDQHSPAAGQHAGELMVKYGKQYNVDPLALLSIAGQETSFGKKGIGVNGMLGVGAYDANPRNAVNNSAFSGIENQIRRGAQTFDKLRARGGSNPNDPMSKQLSAVNRAGWASDRNWHNGVSNIYNRVTSSANQYAQTHPVTQPTQTAAPAPRVQPTPTQTTQAAPPTPTVQPTQATQPTQASQPSPTTQTAQASAPTQESAPATPSAAPAEATT